MYFLKGPKEAEQKIESDLDYIKKALLQRWSNIISEIWLVGGFGRGEGTLIAINNNVTPYNDYDILIVSKKRIPKNELKSLSLELAQACDINFVDLGCILARKLPNLKPSVFTIDMKSSQCIFGPGQAFSKIPNYSNTELSKTEAIIQIQNRAICFLEKTPAFFFEKTHDITESQKYSCALQISKAVIAAHIAHLIVNNSYTSSYEEQKNISDQSTTNKQRRVLIDTAYSLKLNFITPEEIDLISYWFLARDYFLETCKKIYFDPYLLPHRPPGWTYEAPSMYLRLRHTGLKILQLSDPPNLFAQSLIFEAAILQTLAVSDHKTVDSFINSKVIERLQKLNFQTLPKDWYGLNTIIDKVWQKYNH